jgi:hypothetical protein
VRIHNPQSLAAAMSLARQVELMELDRQALAPAPARPAPRGLLPASAPRLALPAPPPASAGGARQEPKLVKRLSTEEQAERRRLGLCYNCDEKYSRGHNRVCRRLFYIDGVTLTDAEEAALDGPDAEAPVFSLQAVAGVPPCDTMQVRVKVGAVTLTALLDTGSSHNFIAEEAARRTNLPVQSKPRLTATMANGEKL